jgi:hypothetical protein
MACGATIVDPAAAEVLAEMLGLPEVPDLATLGFGGCSVAEVQVLQRIAEEGGALVEAERKLRNQGKQQQETNR